VPPIGWPDPAEEYAMTPLTVARVVAVVVAAAAILAGVVAFLPAPVQVLALLLTLPLGASLFATASTAPRRVRR
jgi:hypothetical protein